MPNLSINRLRYGSIVLGESERISAISDLVLPSTTGWRTSFSRGLRISSGLSLPSFTRHLEENRIIHRLLSIVEKWYVTPMVVQIQTRQFVNNGEPEIIHAIIKEGQTHHWASEDEVPENDDGGSGDYFAGVVKRIVWKSEAAGSQRQYDDQVNQPLDIFNIS